MHQLFLGTDAVLQKVKELQKKEGIGIFIIEDNEDARKRVVQIMQEVFPLALIDVLEKQDFIDVETHILQSTHEIILLDNSLSGWTPHPRFKQLGILLAPFIKERTNAVLGLISNDPTVNQLAVSNGYADFGLNKDDLSMLSEILS